MRDEFNTLYLTIHTLQLTTKAGNPQYKFELSVVSMLLLITDNFFQWVSIMLIKVAARWV